MEFKDFWGVTLDVDGINITIPELKEGDKCIFLVSEILVNTTMSTHEELKVELQDKLALLIDKMDVGDCFLVSGTGNAYYVKDGRFSGTVSIRGQQTPAVTAQHLQTLDALLQCADQIPLWRSAKSAVFLARHPVTVGK